MRIVGLDIGERRIGVAVSDVTRTLARPIGVLQSTGLDDDAPRVAAAEVARLNTLVQQAYTTGLVRKA